MSDLIKAANEAGKLVKMLKGIEELSKAMEKLGSIEQATSEALSILDAKRAEISTAEAELLESRAKIDEEKKNAICIADEASFKSSSILDDAKTKADGLMKDALLRQQATEEKLTSLESQVNNLHGKIQARQKDLDDIESKIIKAKNYLTKIAAA